MHELQKGGKKRRMWAREKADWYDPHIEKGDDLLIEVDRATLAFKTQKNI